MRATFLVTLFQVHYMEHSSIPAMQAIEVWSPTVQIRQLLRRENKLSRR
jgi:hypothetical protein